MENVMTFSLDDLSNTPIRIMNIGLNPLLVAEYDGTAIMLPIETRNWNQFCFTFEDRTGGRLDFPRCGFIMMPDFNGKICLLLSATLMRTCGWHLGDDLDYTVRNDISDNQRLFMSNDELENIKLTTNFTKSNH
jgi:hypothetical protein